MGKLVPEILRDKYDCRVLAGVLHGRHAFGGPEVLHIDLTNRCNFNCIACWCRSPLLRDRQMPDWEKKLILPLDIIKGVFDDLAAMGGLRQVKLVGGGEPFMHPDIIKVVQYAREKIPGVDIDINTNFSLMNHKKAEQLIDAGLASFTVSMWSGSPEAYCAVHPNQSVRTFHHIKDVLMGIAESKKHRDVRHPRIIIHNVVFNRNFRDVKNMIDFALDVGAEVIQFVPVDPVKDRTEELLMTPDERSELLTILDGLLVKYDERSHRYRSDDGREILLPDFGDFARRIRVQDLTSGAYDQEKVQEYPCYTGWLFARIMGTGNVVPCCKGHRMHMGNIYNNRFREIWHSPTYEEFRHNGLHMSKCDPYFAKMGNEASKKTGCYNCDNLWQNIPTHQRVTALTTAEPAFAAQCEQVLKSFF